VGETRLRNPEKKRGGTGAVGLTIRRSVWEWSCDFVGDPASWGERGAKIAEFLKENGTTPESQVLEIGCGNLSQGKPLIEFLAPGHYCALEPAGWLVEAALAQFPRLESQAPRFEWRVDFDASGFRRDFDVIVAHSVLSHCAHHQLDELLARTREVARPGAVFLCSYRRGEANSFARDWVYPGVARFRFETIRASGLHFGWDVQQVPDYTQRLLEVAPADEHDWLRMLAVPSAAETNDFRLVEEERRRVETEAAEAAEAAWREVHEAAEREEESE
jgi:SAM-dependent methyltransferase